MTEINERILEKLKKFSKNPTELKMCEELLKKEILWLNNPDPPFKRDFPHFLNKFFPFEDND